MPTHTHRRRPRLPTVGHVQPQTATSDTPATPFWLTVWRHLLRHGRFAATLTVVLGMLLAVALVRAYGPANAGLIVGPVVAVALLPVSRRLGLSWSDLGLARRNWAKGGAAALAAVVAVGTVYALAAAHPLTRAAFMDTRYQLPAKPALVSALLVIPLGTVLVEEIAFRGVLQGMLTRHRGVGWGLGISSALFGAWHILPSLRLHDANQAVGQLTGGGPAAQLLTVAGTVVFTAAAGVLLGEMRRRSGSLLASAGMHWAVNGLGVLATAALHAAATR